MKGPVVVDIEGLDLSAAERDRIAHPLTGMVILFSRNYASPQQLTELTAAIHQTGRDEVLVAVDHEGGRVQRFREGFTAIPPMAALGRQWDRDVLLALRRACSTGYVLAAELRAHGVDFTFAPVLDLAWGHSAVIGERALHADARVVTALAQQLIHGFALAGMANCGKHFPGHGWAAADSHLALPIDTRPLDEILQADAMPYGLLGPALRAVMPAHLVYPSVDEAPAGYSRRWIDGLLRRRLDFHGAVFSDDLSMRGAHLADDAGVPVRARQALAAGCDFVLVCNDPAGADAVLSALDWRPTAAFAARAAALCPRGDAVSVDALRAMPSYRQACADVDEVRRG